MLSLSTAVCAVLLGGLLCLSGYLQANATMRGTHRRPLPEMRDKLIRLFFQGVQLAPLVVLLNWINGVSAVHQGVSRFLQESCTWTESHLLVPAGLCESSQVNAVSRYAFALTLCVLVGLYIPSFLDGSEKSGRRASTWMWRSAILGWVRRYFSLSLEMPFGKLRPFSLRHRYIVCIHPHGFLPIGGMCNVLSAFETEDEAAAAPPRTDDSSAAHAKVVDLRRNSPNGAAPASPKPQQCESSPVRAAAQPGRPASGATPRMPVRALVASFCFYVPIMRDLYLLAGLIDASRYNAARILSTDDDDNGCHGASAVPLSIAVVPGGATEALYAVPHRHTVLLSTRLGFVKLALETDALLVPTYTFGETNYLVPALQAELPGNGCDSDGEATSAPSSSLMRAVACRIQRGFQSVFGLSLPILLNPIPRRGVKVTSVYGQPLRFVIERDRHPTPEEVQRGLDAYICELRQLFDTHAPRFIENPAERKLIVV